jgi:hypothetical protein
MARKANRLAFQHAFEICSWSLCFANAVSQSFAAYIEAPFSVNRFACSQIEMFSKLYPAR